MKTRFQWVMGSMHAVAFAALTTIVVGMAGCKERIVDVETPRGSVHVDKDTQTGKVNVEVNRQRPAP